MKENNFKDHYGNSSHSQSHSQVKAATFEATLENIKEILEIEELNTNDRQAAEEISLIIAEVMILHPETEIRINGTAMPVQLVQAIYSRLSSEHILLVLENFQKVTYEIKHKKTYLRTALYNSVFESSAYWQNRVNVDMALAGRERK